MEKIWAQTRQKSSHKTALNSLGHQRPVVAKGLSLFYPKDLVMASEDQKFDYSQNS